MQRDTVFQTDLWGNVTVAGDIPDRITYLLETYPETRSDYKALMARYWIEFDGLSELLGDLPTLRAAFRAWFIGVATSPKTLQNRCMEIQNKRPDLEATSEVRRERERQSRQGPVVW